MTLELITIRELLRDPRYKEYFLKPPLLPNFVTPEMKPWKLMVMKKDETKWRAKRFGTYREAFDGFKRMLPTIDNAAINCPAFSFMPPVRNVRVKGKTMKVGKKTVPLVRSLVWKPQITSDMESHTWCSHCRRPSIFKMITYRPREVGGFNIPQVVPAMRCIICGASERIVDLRNPLNAQKWDSNRPKIY